MTRPRTSGHCATAGQTPDPLAAHHRCTLTGCACVCHTPQAPPPRVKVPLSCLQGRHTTSCGHQAPTSPPAGEHTSPVTSPAGADPHTCAWELGPRADGTLVCACGAFIRDGQAVYPDDLEPPGEQLTIGGISVAVDVTMPPGVAAIRDDRGNLTPLDPYAWPPLLEKYGDTTLGELDAHRPPFTGLTDDERRRIIAGHLELHPATILATVETIIRERTMT